MDEISLREQIPDIISRIMNRPLNLHNEDYDALLTGSRFDMGWIDMVYLFLEIQKTYGVRFNAEQFEDNGFNSINRIVKQIVSLHDLK